MCRNKAKARVSNTNYSTSRPAEVLFLLMMLIIIVQKMHVIMYFVYGFLEYLLF